MSTDVIAFVNKAVRSGESDKILVKEKKGQVEGAGNFDNPHFQV